MSKKEKQNRIPELLAPAGTKEAFIAAVEACADAIYLGGEKLNARMSAGNFSLPEMKEAIDFAHKRHVKVYVTVNTLVRDDEIEEALNYCGELYEMGADAVIIQDLGFGYLVKKRFPSLPIHLSTQGSVYDYDGVEAAASLGYERVVLARELSLSEIKEICKRSNAEVEVFCHGALCICYSGQCQMSRAIGARSGNRGACAQPCRLAYEIEKNGQRSKKAHYLSPSDMNTIDLLAELADAGVASLKIEGRMKSPEYVAVVTSIYRKYLDEYASKGSYSVSDEDRTALEQIFNRGFTTAYLKGDDEDFMSMDKPKHRGVYIGEVLSSEKIKGKEDRSIVTALLSADVKKNDVLEIGDDAMHCTVTLLDGNSRGARIGDVIGHAKPGDKIYRMVSQDQISYASIFYKNKDWHSGKYIRRTLLDADIVSTKDGIIKLILRDELGNSVEAMSGPFEHSEEHDASDRIRESLKKTGGTAFEIKTVKLHGGFAFKIPVSEINELRRAAISKMEETLSLKVRERKECSVDSESKDSVSTYGTCDESLRGRANEKRVELYYYDINSFINDDCIKEEIEKVKSGFSDEINIAVVLPAAQLVFDRESVFNKASELEADIIPYISNISKGREDKIIEDNFDAICKLASTHGIYVGNINWIRRFFDRGVKVLGDYGLNKYNRWTEEAVRTLGVLRAVDSLEAFDIGSGILGSAPLMISEHAFEGDALIDRKGAKYRIVKRDYSDQDIIALDSNRSISACIGELVRAGAEDDFEIRVYI